MKVEDQGNFVYIIFFSCVYFCILLLREFSNQLAVL